MRKIAAAWERFWLRAAAPSALALFRIAFYGTILLVYLRWDVRAWAQVSTLFWIPVSFFRFLPPWWRNTALIGAMQIVWKFSLAAAAAGLFTRTASIIAAGFGLFLLGLPFNAGKIDHEEGIVVIMLCIFCFARSADALSLDARFRSPQKAPADSFEYGWPLQLIRAMFILIFFAAGISKLRTSGLAWMTAVNIRYLLLAHNYVFHTPTNLGLLAAKSPLITGVAGIATVVLELSMPLALFSSRLRFPLIAASLSMQAMIALCMGIYFTPFLAGYVSFLPWEQWGAALPRHSANRDPVKREGVKGASMNA
jgi:hypothetical protein